MKIFFEFGNTRIKAALLDSQGNYTFLGALEKSHVLTGDFIQLLGLNDLDGKDVKVYFCSVTSAADNADLIEHIKGFFKCYPTELRTEPKCCGVVNGYDQFEQLGVDRWMSIVSVAESSSKPVVVVSMGTAMTIDVVIDKTHLGGFIVPGLSLMRKSLAQNTAQLGQYDMPVEQQEFKLLATNTENAILGGTLYMAASYINAVIKDLENEMNRKFDCVGTGGDFSSVKPLLDKPFLYIEDLTLKGMAKVVESF